MQTLRKRWLPLLIAALVIGGPVAWYKWPSTASAAEAVAHGSGQAGQLQGPRHDHRRAARAQVRPDPGTELAGRPGLPDQDHVDRSRGNGRERRRQDRRARSRAGGDATQRRDARPSEGAGGVHERLAGLHAEPGAVAREDVRTAEYALEEKKLAKEQAQVRGADDQAPGRDRLREGAARARAVEAQPRHEDQAGRREDVAVAGADLGRQQNNLKMVQDVIDGFTIKAPSSGHGDLRSRMERQEEGRRLAVERVGSDRRDAARSLADGVADVRQRSRRSQAVASARRSRSRSTPIRRRSSPAR